MKERSREERLYEVPANLQAGLFHLGVCDIRGAFLGSLVRGSYYWGSIFGVPYLCKAGSLAMLPLSSSINGLVLLLLFSKCRCPMLQRAKWTSSSPCIFPLMASRASREVSSMELCVLHAQVPRMSWVAGLAEAHVGQGFASAEGRPCDIVLHWAVPLRFVGWLGEVLGIFKLLLPGCIAGRIQAEEH